MCSSICSVQSFDDKDIRFKRESVTHGFKETSDEQASSFDQPSNFSANFVYFTFDTVFRDDASKYSRHYYNMEQLKEVKEEITWRKALLLFAMKSTIHGVKRIVEKTPFRIRK